MAANPILGQETLNPDWALRVGADSRFFREPWPDDAAMIASATWVTATGEVTQIYVHDALQTAKNARITLTPLRDGSTTATVIVPCRFEDGKRIYWINRGAVPGVPASLPARISTAIAKERQQHGI